MAAEATPDSKTRGRFLLGFDLELTVIGAEQRRWQVFAIHNTVSF